MMKLVLSNTTPTEVLFDNLGSEAEHQALKAAHDFLETLIKDRATFIKATDLFSNYSYEVILSAFQFGYEVGKNPEILIFTREDSD